MKSSLSLLFLFIFALSLLLPISSVSAAGLIPCGRSGADATVAEQAPCTICHIVLGGKGIIEYGLQIMTFVGIAVIVAMAILYIVSAGDDGMMQTAKSGIKASLIGFAVMLSAWLIVNTTLKVLSATVSTLGITSSGFTFTCNTTSLVKTGVAATGAGATTGTTSGVVAGGVAAVVSPSPVIVTIPSSGPVVTTMPANSTTRVVFNGTPDFSQGPVDVVGVVETAMVPQKNFFVFFGIPTAFSASTGVTITPTTITTMEEWEKGLTITVDKGIFDNTIYSVTLKQNGAVLGVVKVTVKATVAKDTVVGNTVMWGKVVDISGKPVVGVLNCGDPSRNDYTSYNTNFPNGAVGLQKEYCNAKGGKIWVNCPQGLVASPAQMTTDEFNGNTFTCVAPEDPVITFETSVAKKCQSGEYPSYFSLCQPVENRTQYLKDQFAKAPKPMSTDYINSFGPGFTDSHLAFADWENVTVGPFVVSCDESVSKYGLFGGDKNNLGNWREGSNRDFYNSNQFLGSGGAQIHTTQYKDKVTGEPMTEEVISFDAIGFCQH